MDLCDWLVTCSSKLTKNQTEECFEWNGINLNDFSTLSGFDVVEVARGGPGSSDWNFQFNPILVSKRYFTEISWGRAFGAAITYGHDHDHSASFMIHKGTNLRFSPFWILETSRGGKTVHLWRVNQRPQLPKLMQINATTSRTNKIVGQWYLPQWNYQISWHIVSWVWLTALPRWSCPKPKTRSLFKYLFQIHQTQIVEKR